MDEIDRIALRDWAARILVHAGLSESDAACVADTLDYAERRGTASHGYLRLATYVDRILAGGIRGRHRMALVHDDGALAVLDADAAPGAVSGVRAVELALERADRFGIGAALVRNANHFGAAAYFAERAADAGAVAIVACNTDRAMSSPAGGPAVLGTNPLAISLPLPRERRPTLDMATTTAAYGKILVAAEAGDPIPLGWAVDGAGEPTTDAAAALSGGALLPASGPKGFGIAFMIDALAALGGAATSPFVDALYGDPATSQSLGQTVIAIRPPDAADLSRRIDGLVDAVHAGSAPGRPALVPGEPELRARSGAAEHVRVPPGLRAQLDAVAARFAEPTPRR